MHSVEPGMVIHDPDLRTARVRCLTNVHAVQFRDHLQHRGVVVDGIEDDTLLVSYSGSLKFLSEIATTAVLGNYADPVAMDSLLDNAETVEEVLALVAAPEPVLPRKRQNPMAHLIPSGMLVGAF